MASTQILFICFNQIVTWMSSKQALPKNCTISIYMCDYNVCRCTSIHLDFQLKGMTLKDFLERGRGAFLASISLNVPLTASCQFSLGLSGWMHKVLWKDLHAMFGLVHLSQRSGCKKFEPSDSLEGHFVWLQEMCTVNWVVMKTMCMHKLLKVAFNCHIMMCDSTQAVSWRYSMP